MSHYQKLMNAGKFAEAMEYVEKELYTSVFAYSGHNQSKTAKILGVSRGTVIKRLKQYGFLTDVKAREDTV